jgi:hypothetical protein
VCRTQRSQRCRMVSVRGLECRLIVFYSVLAVLRRLSPCLSSFGVWRMNLQRARSLVSPDAHDRHHRRRCCCRRRHHHHHHHHLILLFLLALPHCPLLCVPHAAMLLQVKVEWRFSSRPFLLWEVSHESHAVCDVFLPASLCTCACVLISLTSIFYACANVRV